MSSALSNSSESYERALSNMALMAGPKEVIVHEWALSNLGTVVQMDPAYLSNATKAGKIRVGDKVRSCINGKIIGTALSEASGDHIQIHVYYPDTQSYNDAEKSRKNELVEMIDELSLADLVWLREQTQKRIEDKTMRSEFTVEEKPVDSSWKEVNRFLSVDPLNSSRVFEGIIYERGDGQKFLKVEEKDATS